MKRFTVVRAGRFWEVLDTFYFSAYSVEDTYKEARALASKLNKEEAGL
jgi:hypothetical protein